MSKSDVEMEDPRELPNESGNNPQESKSKLFDAEIESKSEISPPAAAVLGDAKVRENGGDDLNKCNTAVKENTELKIEVNDQINLKSEADKPMEGSVSGEIITKSDNEKQINTETKSTEQINNETKAEEKINTESKVEEQINAEAKAEEQINTEAKAEEQINTETKAEELINTETKAEEKINSGTKAEEQINSETKDEEKTAPVSAVEKQIDAKSEVIEQKAGLEENKPSENGVEGENYQENVEKIHILVMKPKEIGQMEMYNAEPVSGGDLTMENAEPEDKTRENRQLPTELSSNEDPQRQEVQSDEVPQGKDEEMADAVNFDEEKTIKQKEQSVGTVLASGGTGRDEISAEIAAKHDGEESSLSKQQVAKPELLSSCSSAKAVDNNGEMAISIFTQPTLHLTGEGDDGTPEEQTAFMKDLESFYRERGMDFKPPKFYGQPLNCLKLWRSVIRLGGYDRVTGSKLWRQVGESFHPPKTCTTVSWTFRIFYEKSILDFERHKTQSGELQLPVPMLPEVSGVDGEGNGYQGSGPGRARRDSASRAMQGWHAQRLSDSGEVNNMAKHEKNIKSIGSHKQKRPNEVEHSNKAARTELSKQLVSSVVDIGPPADWVKINVRQTKDCFEVYALVPGLLREEVRVQSDPAGRVVITGQPEQADNPWGITAFKKVVSLPARIDPLQTSAVVSLHGRLLVRVPYEQSNISN